MNPQVSPETFKEKILLKYPNGVTSDGRRYADLNPVELTQRIVDKFPDGITSEGIKYKDYLASQSPKESVKTGISGAFTSELPQMDTFLTRQGPSFRVPETGGSIGGNIARTFGNIPSSTRDLTRATLGVIPQTAQNIGNIPGAISGLVRESGGLEPAIRNLSEGFGATLKKGVKIGRGVLENIRDKGAVETIASVAEKGIEDPLLLPSIVYTPSKVRGTGVTDDIIARTARPVTRGADTRLSTIASNLTTKSETQIEKAVLKNFEKGVKPLLPGKSTLAQADRYKTQVVDAVETISANKPYLTFIDEAGDVVTGRSPQSLKELAEALDQTKAVIYKSYDDLARQAGNGGLIIKPSEIADELDAVIGNKALQLTNPRAVKYAEELKDRLIASGSIDAKTAQDVIQNYNKSLDAFYRNPTYDTASQAAIDALIVNRFRKALDEGISGLTGAEYQALKNKYASLKAIEKDVVKAALRDARKNQKGLIDFTDILTGGDIVGGIISLSPGQVGRGLVGRGIKEFYKYLNDPNRAIERMFKAIEGQRRPNSLNTTLPTAGTRLQTQPAASSASTPSTNAINNTLPPNNSVSSQAGFVRNPLAKSSATTKRPLPTKVDPLLTEARKYKSAEEFANAVDSQAPKLSLRPESVKATSQADEVPFTKLYHGTGADFKVFRQPQKGEYGSEAIFLSPSEEGARYYARSEGSKVMPVFVNKNARIWDFNKAADVKVVSDFVQKNGLESIDPRWQLGVDEWIKRLERGDYTVVQRPAVMELLRSKGYDGFKNMDWYDTGVDLSVGIFDPKNTLTKSQLTDIWERANKVNPQPTKLPPQPPKL